MPTISAISMEEFNARDFQRLAITALESLRRMFENTPRKTLLRNFCAVALDRAEHLTPYNDY